MCSPVRPISSNDSKQCPTTTCQCSFFCSKQWLLWLPVVTSLQANVTEALKVVFLENKLLCRSHLPTLSFRITDQLYWSEREYASMNSNMTLTKPFSCQYLTNINGIVFPHQGSATGFSLNPTRTPSPPPCKKKKKKVSPLLTCHFWCVRRGVWTVVSETTGWPIGWRPWAGTDRFSSPQVSASLAVLLHTDREREQAVKQELLFGSSSGIDGL